MKNNFMSLFEKCDDELRTLAFTHSSYANQHRTKSNERLEFLGDSILNTIVSEYLYKHYNQNEGKMSKVRASLVCEEYLAAIAKELNIEGKILFGKSLKKLNISNSILADTIECMIGAIFLSFGLHSISSAVLEQLKIKEFIATGTKVTDNKSELQEYMQGKKIKLKYECEKYLTKGGQENFKSSVFVDEQFVAFGQGSTKRESEQNAAKKVLLKLKTKK